MTIRRDKDTAGRNTIPRYPETEIKNSAFAYSLIGKYFPDLLGPNSVGVNFYNDTYAKSLILLPKAALQPDESFRAVGRNRRLSFMSWVEENRWELVYKEGLSKADLLVAWRGTIGNKSSEVYVNFVNQIDLSLTPADGKLRVKSGPDGKWALETSIKLPT